MFFQKPETIQVSHNLLQDPNFFQLLLQIDIDLAAQTPPVHVSVAARSIKPTIHANRAVALLKYGIATRRASAFVVAGAASARRPCRCVFWGGVCICHWRWCCSRPGMPGRLQRPPSRNCAKRWLFLRELFNVGVPGGLNASQQRYFGRATAPASCPRSIRPSFRTA